MIYAVASSNAVRPAPSSPHVAKKLRSSIKPAGARSKKIRQTRPEFEHNGNLLAIDEMARRDLALLKTFFGTTRAHAASPTPGKKSNERSDAFTVEFVDEEPVGSPSDPPSV